MEEAKPVVLTKPVRGREMLSKKGLLDKDVLSRSTEPDESDKKKGETYYEGYVDGQLFLVPDSNLEAMKDMINFKMRPKTSIRYKHQTSYDIQYYDQFTEKLNELLSKIDDFQDSGDFESVGEESSEEEISTGGSKDTKPVEETIENISKENVKEDTSKERIEDDISNKEKTKLEKVPSNESVKSKIQQIKSEIVQELEKEYAVEDDISLSSSGSQISTIPGVFNEPREMQNLNKNNDLRIRFLISGHFKDGENPIYIVQEHDGRNDIFKDQKLDFTSSQENSKANIFISGKLYKENILVESDSESLFLNTTPDKIIINENSKIFNDSFEHVFDKGDCCVLMKGSFLNNDNHKITPSLSFCVKEKSTSFNSEGDKEESW